MPRHKPAHNTDKQESSDAFRVQNTDQLLAVLPENSKAQLSTYHKSNNSQRKQIEPVHTLNGIAANQIYFDNNEFNAIKYYSSEGGGQLSHETSDARIAYYGAEFYPTCIFDGQSWVIGADDVTATASF